MKIEDSPYHFGGTSPVEKLRRQQPAVQFSLDDLDLSFLDLLTTVVADTDVADAKPEHLSPEETRQGEKAATTTSPKEGAAKPKLTLVPKPAPVEEPPMEVAKDMELLQADLTPQDIQYMKQVVIPGLPILMGNVPVESIFPAEADGSVSAHGYDISPGLAELIEKGYKTGRPIRVELDTRSSVVLKIRNGLVSAEFVSSDKTVALMMQQEINDLRHRMSQKNLPVGLLDAKYRDPQQQGQSRSGAQDQDDEQ